MIRSMKLLWRRIRGKKPQLGVWADYAKEEDE